MIRSEFIFTLIISMLSAGLPLIAQHSPLDPFSHLVGKTWHAEGSWGNGTAFKQTVSFSYSLGGQVVLATSLGFTDEAQTRFGLRNQGIRQYDPESGKVKFWEFDVFGGLTEGTVTFEEDKIIYQYEYGESMVTDMWERVDDSTYTFKVGTFKDGEWSAVYLDTRFKADPSLKKRPADLPDLKALLPGNWTSKAWDGRLDEQWSIGTDGHIHQQAQYLEGDEVLFQSANKIEIVNGEVVLFTVIKDNNPKIFKATSWSKDHITFENSDYANPNRVHYAFQTDGTFHRTISGVEDGKATSYTFMFER